MLEQLEELVWQTGQAVLALGQTNNYRIQAKADESPLTEADTLADSMLCQGLEAISSWPIISEERVRPLNQGEPKRYWLIDPIDGTKEYIANRPTYTINVALIEGGVPILGVVYAPSLGELYSGTLQKGLRLNRKAFRPSTWPEAKTLVCSVSHVEAELENFASDEGFQERIAIGSSYKFCLVAAGKAHCYPRFRSLSAWDIAAGHAVALAAGCQVLSRVDGGPVEYRFHRTSMPPFVVLAPGFNLQDVAGLR